MNIDKAYEWYATQSAIEQPGDNVSQSRDVFQARLAGMLQALLRYDPKGERIALISAVVGEIGNNCFDHNLGKWKDAPGCWFQYQLADQTVTVIIADRGQGILSSLKRVEPSLNDDQTAIQMAFEKRISGRSPEKRGNGLKFVCAAINNHSSRGLAFRSGKGEVFFGGLTSVLRETMNPYAMKNRGGTFSLIQWKLSNES